MSDNIVTIGSVTLINADCMDPAVHAMVDSHDLLLDDPPYLGLSGNIKDYVREGGRGAGPGLTASTTVGDPWGANLDWLSRWIDKVRLGAVVFSGTAMLPTLLSQQVGDLLAVGVWYKRNAMPPLRPVPRACVEYYPSWRRAAGLDWRRFPPHLDIPTLPAGMTATERLLSPDSKRALHPAQKPLSLMSSILAICPPGTSVLDLHTGTGTVPAACLRQGLKCTAVERDRTYFAAAVARCRRELGDSI